MARTFSFSIPGRPRAHQRHRSRILMSGRKAIAIQYNPPANKEWAAIVQTAWHEKHKQGPVWDPVGTFRLVIDCRYKCPKTPRKSEPHPADWRTARPDIDNLVKGVMDAMNGLAWEDDAQVAEIVARKIHAQQGEKPRVDVRVEELDAGPAPVVQAAA